MKSENVLKLEKFIETYQEGRILSLENGLLNRVKYALSGMYGRVEGYEMHRMTERQIERKVAICSDLLDFLGKVDPGISSRRGMVMYEIHAPMVMLAQLRLRKGILGKKEAEKEFRKGLIMLKMAKELLKYDQEGSFEKKVYYGAQASIEPLEAFIKENFAT